jgi:hypothetical protein
MNRLMMSLTLLGLLACAPLARAEWTLREDLGHRVGSIEVATFATEHECRDGARIAALAIEAANEDIVVTAHGEPSQVVVGDHVYVLRCTSTVVQTPR